ncbi:DUF2339 domain-containing protein [Kaistia terrae]|uniref:DUF2339 domain-containing protein n=1 Tax=Kaistia terrae TaxID=537017 RepID=A0ABW0PS85_9HYPH|nr:DUF2339 domain-containing protein [Kaistia terrae]MCX5577571.1 DUF2339 domain-containing protein [Kaistia terrae]
MDEWIAIGIIALIALPIMAIAAFVMSLGARSRIRALESRLSLLEARGSGAIAAMPFETPPYIAPDPLSFETDTPKTDTPKTVPATGIPSDSGTGGFESEEPALPEWVEATGVSPSKEPKRPKESFEQKLGARWAVWVGGLALALGAIFLVRFSIEAGLLGPGVRIAFGALFSFVLLGLGEWLRRSDRVTSFSRIPAANVPGVLTAAGTVGLFATVYAAYALYGLIGPTAAFILLAVIGMGTMAAAGLHGAWLSGLGLVGSYVTPLLISTDAPNILALMIYLIVVTAFAFALARLRLWRWLAIAASVAAILWGVGMLVGGASAIEGGIYAIILLTLTSIFLVVDVQRDTTTDRPDWFAIGVLAGLAALLVLGAIASHFTSASIAACLVGGAMLLLLSRRYDAVAFVAPVAAIELIALLYFWPAVSQAAVAPVTYIVDALSIYFPLPDAIRMFGVVGLLGAAALIATALTRLQATPEAGPFATTAQAAAASAGPVIVAIVAYLRITGFVSSIAFAAIALALAALYAVLTERFARRERPESALDQVPTGLFAAGAIAASASALTMALEGGMLTTALALAALGAAWVQLRRPIGVLRYAVAVLALLVLARIAWDPYIFGVRAGGGVYLSVLIGYGIPAAAFAIASVLLRRVRVDRSVFAAEALAVIMAALLVVFEIRAIVFGGDLLSPTTALSEQGLTTAAAFAFSLGLSRLAQSRPSPVFGLGSVIARVLGLLNAVIGLGFVANPLFTGDAVGGGPVFNEILLAYGLPAVLAGLVALRTPPLRLRWLQAATGVVALILAFAAVTLEIRFLFATSPDLSWDPIGSAESYTYSVAWLVLGILLLAFGLVFQQRAARLASALLIVVTVLKVFLIDMSNLEGVWRALSFMGLGAVLIGIGLVYQRLLFGGAKGSDEADQPPPESGPTADAGNV